MFSNSLVGAFGQGYGFHQDDGGVLHPLLQVVDRLFHSGGGNGGLLYESGQIPQVAGYEPFIGEPGVVFGVGSGEQGVLQQYAAAQQRVNLVQRIAVAQIRRRPQGNDGTDFTGRIDCIGVQRSSQPRGGFALNRVSRQVFVFNNQRRRAFPGNQDVGRSSGSGEGAGIFTARRPAAVQVAEQGSDTAVELVFDDGHSNTRPF